MQLNNLTESTVTPAKSGGARGRPAPEQRGDDAVVFRVAQLFLGARNQGLSPSAIAEQVSREFRGRRGLTREAIYPLIGEAVRRGFLKLVPPVSQQLAERVLAKYPSLESCTLRVVETAGPHDNAKVAVVAAEVALDHLGEILFLPVTGL